MAPGQLTRFSPLSLTHIHPLSHISLWPGFSIRRDIVSAYRQNVQASSKGQLKHELYLPLNTPWRLHTTMCFVSLAIMIHSPTLQSGLSRIEVGHVTVPLLPQPEPWLAVGPGAELLTSALSFEVKP